MAFTFDIAVGNPSRPTGILVEADDSLALYLLQSARLKKYQDEGRINLQIQSSSIRLGIGGHAEGYSALQDESGFDILIHLSAKYGELPPFSSASAIKILCLLQPKSSHSETSSADFMSLERAFESYDTVVYSDSHDPLAAIEALISPHADFCCHGFDFGDLRSMLVGSIAMARRIEMPGPGDMQMVFAAAAALEKEFLEKWGAPNCMFIHMRHDQSVSLADEEVLLRAINRATPHSQFSRLHFLVHVGEVGSGIELTLFICRNRFEKGFGFHGVLAAAEAGDGSHVVIKQETSGACLALGAMTRVIRKSGYVGTAAAITGIPSQDAGQTVDIRGITAGDISPGDLLTCFPITNGGGGILGTGRVLFRDDNVVRGIPNNILATPDGWITSSWWGQLCFWTRDLKLMKTLECHGPILDIMAVDEKITDLAMVDGEALGRKGRMPGYLVTETISGEAISYLEVYDPASRSQVFVCIASSFASRAGKLAAGDGGGDLRIWESGESRSYEIASEVIYSLEWSPTGNYLVACCTHGIGENHACIIKDTGDTIRILHREESTGSIEAAFSHDETALLISNIRDQHLLLYSIGELACREIGRFQTRILCTLSMDAAGENLAMVMDRRNDPRDLNVHSLTAGISVVPGTGRFPIIEIAGEMRVFSNPQWYAGLRAYLELTEAKLYQCPENTACCEMVLSTDGRYLAALEVIPNGEDSMQRLIVIDQATGEVKMQDEFTPCGHIHLGVRYMQFMPDSTTLLVVRKPVPFETIVEKIRLTSGARETVWAEWNNSEAGDTYALFTDEKTLLMCYPFRQIELPSGRIRHRLSMFPSSVTEDYLRPLFIPEADLIIAPHRGGLIWIVRAGNLDPLEIVEPAPGIQICSAVAHGTRVYVSFTDGSVMEFNCASSAPAA